MRNLSARTDHPQGVTAGENAPDLEDEMTVHAPVTLPDLERRFSEAIEAGTGIDLTAEEFALFDATGAWALLQEALAHEQNPMDFPSLSEVCTHCTRAAGTWIYFIRAGSVGAVKIGYTRRPKDRLWALQLASSEPLQFIALFRSAQAHERQLHNFYEREWLRGEWYRASPRLLAYAEYRGIET